jgi:hypothetical protein
MEVVDDDSPNQVQPSDRCGVRALVLCFNARACVGRAGHPADHQDRVEDLLEPRPGHAQLARPA